MSRITIPSRNLLAAFLASLLLVIPVAGFAESRIFSGNLTLQKYGSGELRRFGFLVYEAQLWAGTNPAEPPIALQLTYKRDIAGLKIANASLDHMRDLGATDQQLALWGPALTRIFPDVRPGDQIIGIYRAGTATFLFNNREIGQVNDADFARLFFGIWLDPRTAEPKLRQRLMQAGTG
jgi:hypothetical protein